AMTPPQLTGDTPVADILHPVEIDILPAFGVEGHAAIADSSDCGCCQWLHRYEPLLRKPWFDGGVAAIAMAYGMIMVIDMVEKAKFLKGNNDRLTCLFASHTRKATTLFVDDGILIHDVQLLK